MSSKSKGTKVKSYMEKREFYLWGIVPKEQVVPLDYALLKGGLNDSASNVSFGVYRSFVDTALAVITFGLYSPNHFIVKGSGEIFE